MSLNPLAPVFLPNYQFPSNPPISQCKSAAMILPLAQLFCGVPLQVIPFHSPPINQPITEGILLSPLILPKNPSMQDAEAHQPFPGSSSLLSSPLEHQANCLQAIHNTIQQFNQHLKAENPRPKDITTHCPSTAE